VALLLVGVPVAIGMLGAVRWLPLGEITTPGLGLTIQGLGVAAMLYAVLAGVKRTQLKLLPAYAAIIATGMLAIILGAGQAPALFPHRGGESFPRLARYPHHPGSSGDLSDPVARPASRQRRP